MFDVARTIEDLGLVIHSTQATYGERVVHVFAVDVIDVFATKIAQPTKLASMKKALLQVLPEPGGVPTIG